VEESVFGGDDGMTLLLLNANAVKIPLADDLPMFKEMG